jgi:hypothetical protein
VSLTPFSLDSFPLQLTLESAHVASLDNERAPVAL